MIKDISTALDSRKDSDFRKIYMHTASLLHRVARKIVNDEEAAEDLVHDSFIKMHEKAMVFPSENDAKFWLIRVVHNASINYANRKKRERKSYEKVLSEPVATTEPTGDNHLVREEARKKINAALNKINPNLRSVLFFREYVDLSYKEISRILGISESNVKVRIFRAREQLSKILGGDDEFVS